MLKIWRKKEQKVRTKIKRTIISICLYTETHPWSMNKNPLMAHVHILRKEKKKNTTSISSVQRTFMIYEQKWRKENVLTVNYLLQPLRTMPQNTQTGVGTDISHIFLDVFPNVVEQVLLPLTRQQRRWKNIWHWCQPIHLLLDCQLFHLLCTSDGRSVKHHTWMICGEVKMSHGLDAKQWQGWKTLASCRLAPEQFHPLFPSAGECWPWTLECFHPPPSSCPLSKTHHLSAEKSLHG